MPLSAVVLILAVAGAALLQGGVGFGFAILAAPIVALVDPTLVPGPMIVVLAFVASMIAWRERSDLHLGDVAWASLGRLPGNLVGAMAVVLLPSRAITIALASSVLLAVILSSVQVRVARSPRSLAVAGLASGLMGTATSAGGPPIALVYAGAPAAVFRGTLALFFLVGAVTSLITLAVAGELPMYDLGRGVVLALPVAAGIAASKRLARYMDDHSVRPAVLVLSTLSALSLLARELGWL